MVTEREFSPNLVPETNSSKRCREMDPACSQPRAIRPHASALPVRPSSKGTVALIDRRARRADGCLAHAGQHLVAEASRVSHTVALSHFGALLRSEIGRVQYTRGRGEQRWDGGGTFL
jgi:hypothetical protein